MMMTECEFRDGFWSGCAKCHQAVEGRGAINSDKICGGSSGCFVWRFALMVVEVGDASGRKVHRLGYANVPAFLFRVQTLMLRSEEPVPACSIRV